jgi:hypothetical protein
MEGTINIQLIFCCLRKHTATVSKQDMDDNLLVENKY